VGGAAEAVEHGGGERAVGGCDREDRGDAVVVGCAQGAVEGARVRRGPLGLGQPSDAVGGRDLGRRQQPDRPGGCRRGGGQVVGVDEPDDRARGVVRGERAGARTAASGSCTSRPVTASISSTPTAPGRSSRGTSPVQSTIVDSTPTSLGPPSSTQSRAGSRTSPSSSTTCAASVGETRPNRLALGAATPPPNSTSSA